MEVLREIITKREAKCLRGRGIPEGTTLHVIKEAPSLKRDYKVLVVRVDNGTGHLDLMPETAVRDKDVE